MRENLGLGKPPREAHRLIFARIIDYDDAIDIVLLQHLAVCLKQRRLGIICRHHNHDLLFLIHVTPAIDEQRSL